MQRCEEAKKQSLLRFELFRKIKKILDLIKRNILISPLEGEKKFLSELCELRNFREGDNLKQSFRNSNFDRRLYFLKNINYNSDMLHHDKNYKGRLGILAQHEAGFEPSPEFLSSPKLTKKFNPLTKREGSDSVISNNYSDTNHSLLTTHYSLISDMVFSRFTSHYFSRKRTAFTLAEVLITLGIIGIVAALTFPTLIANYRVSVLKNDFKKADTIIQQAIQKTVTEAGYDDITSFNIPGRHVTTENWAELQNQTAELNEYWLKQFSVTKAVTENELTKLKYSCSGLLGQGEFCRYYDNKYVNKMYFLSNGMLISPLIPQYGGINHPGLIRVKFDTNGLKGPNRFGYDIFIYESLLGYATLCSPVLQVNYSQWGCYYYAHKDTSPIDSSKSYWDILYKPKSYWTDSK